MRIHRLTDRLQLLASDLADSLDLASFDLVVSNPPYVGRDEAETLSAEILDFEPDTALFAGAVGDAVHQRLLTELDGLRPESWLVLEIGADQEELMRQLSTASSFHLVEVRPDYAGHPRIAVLQRR
jgi:release factor glutamine methyltransferase